MKSTTKPPSDGYGIVIILASAYGGVKADSSAETIAKSSLPVVLPSPVILSGAKNPIPSAETLRSAQNDNLPDFAIVLSPAYTAAFARRREGLQWRCGPRLRRDGRVDDGGGLENRYAGDCIVGSNPTPSATGFAQKLVFIPDFLCRIVFYSGVRRALRPVRLVRCSFRWVILC